jgi:hypothetical protein
MAQLDLVTYMPEKKLMKKKYSCGLWLGHELCFFEKVEKTRKNGL